MTLTWPLPSGFMLHTSAAVKAPFVKAILLPAGDHTGRSSTPGPVLVRFVTPEPSAFILKISSSKLTPERNTIWVLFGDQSGSKLSTQKTYLSDAQDRGAELLANCRVERILVEGGRATGVEARWIDPEQAGVEVERAIQIGAGDRDVVEPGRGPARRHGGGRSVAQPLRDQIAGEHVLDRLVAADQLGLEQPDDGLGHRVVVGVPDRSDRGSQAGLAEAFGVADRGVLRPGIRVVHQPLEGVSAACALPDPHLQGVQDQVGLHRG